MRSLDKTRMRLRSLGRRPNVELELEAELRFHRDQLIEENISSGMPPEEARRAAHRMIGGIAQYKEECRDMRRLNFVEDLVQDVRYTIRSLAKSPGFTGVVVATLALGIGANTAIFTIVHGVLLRPLDYPKPDQLMYLTAESPAIGGTRNALSAPEYTEFRQMNQSFAAVGAYSTGGTAYTTGEANLTAEDRPLRVRSISVDAPRTELNALVEDCGERVGTKDHVPTNRPLRAVDHTPQLRALQDAIVGNASRPIWVLQAAVGCVLLIVCANLANLTMARAGSRRREFVLRAALGASRGRLLRQAVTESAVMSGAGGILGLWLAGAGVRALIRAYPTSIPRTSELRIDLPVLLVALGLSTGTALLFGFVSLGRGRTSSMATALKEGASGAWRHYARRGLVIAQVAFAVMLVIGAGLLVQTVYNLTRIDAGFDRSRLATFSMTLPMANSEPEARAQASQRVLDRLRSLRGVLGTAAMSCLPPNRTPDAIATPIENYTSDDGRHFEIVDYYQFVMGDFFGTMGIPIVAGRGFERTDNASQGKVVIVNETLAKRIWKGQNPIGQRLRPPGGSFGASDDFWHTVIGVAKDVRQRGVERPAGTELYVSLDQHGVSPPSMNVVMRTTLPAAALSGITERVVREVDATVPVVRLRDMDSVFAESIH